MIPMPKDWFNLSISSFKLSDISNATVVHCNEQTLCDLEIKKENPDKTILEKECEVLAKEYEKNKKYGFASWYYILAYERYQK